MTGHLVPVILATTLILTLLPDRSSAGQFLCTPCRSDEECDKAPPDYCVWGEARNACDRRVCAKGPGERCGGPLNVLGICGEGLICRGEVCRGCYIQAIKCDED